MIEIGDRAPDFTLPAAYGETYDDVGEFRLSDATDEGIVVLAFFPAAFTGGCTEEMCAFRDSIARFNESDAQVYGISVDLPPALNVFIQEHGLNFPLLSDFNQEVIAKYGVVRDDLYGVSDVARRSVFVIADGEVVYTWVRTGDERPEYAELVRTVEQAVNEHA